VILALKKLRQEDSGLKVTGLHSEFKVSQNYTARLSQKKKKKQVWAKGSSGRAPCLASVNPEFKPQEHQRNKQTEKPRAVGCGRVLD
jgi:hypothetical protein